jgi:membrane protein involved in colicin uptake
VYRRKEDAQMVEPTVVALQKLNKPSPQGSKSKPQQSKKQLETQQTREPKRTKPEAPSKPRTKNWERERYQPSEVQDLSVLIWNVRGLNTKHKQHLVTYAIR